jgi:hypothetical protein
MELIRFVVIRNKGGFFSRTETKEVYMKQKELQAY